MKRVFLLATFLTILLVFFAACDSNETPAVDTSSAGTDSETTIVAPVETEATATEPSAAVTEPETNEPDTVPAETAPVATQPVETEPVETDPVETETDHVHVWGDWTTVQEATCTENGVQERTCACGEKETQHMDRLSHSFTDWMTIKDPTCVETGLSQRYCTVCNYTESKPIEATGHTEVKVDEVAPTCTETGLSEGTKCSGCGEFLTAQEVIPATGHSFGDWYTTKEATEAEKGELRRDCSKCDGFEVTVIAELSHDHNRWDTIIIDGVVPTCTEPGLTAGKKCSGCGEILESQKDIPATGHTYRTVVTKPTCTKQGHTTHSCHCGDSYVDSYVAALGHSMGSWKQTKAPTCTEKGTEKRDCANCDYTESRKIEAAGHNHESIVTAPTAIKDGYITYTCFACGDTYEKTIIPETFMVTQKNRVMVGFTGKEDENLVIPTVFQSEDGTWFRVEGIGMFAFEDCKSLNSIEIPDSVTSIGNNAFAGCTNLENITIPASVTTIWDRAFSGCESLQKVNITDLSAWLSIMINFVDMDGNGLFEADEVSNPLSNGADLYINGELVDDLVIPSTVTSIKDGAFYGCTSLTSIEIPDSVTTIGDHAFNSCSNLSTVTFGENSQLTTIGGSAFDGCTGLTSMVIPDSVTSIGERAFEGCVKLASVTFGNNSQLSTIGYKAFRDCTGLTSIEIPAGATTIGKEAFRDCASLTSITINSETWVAYSNHLLYGCIALTTIYVPADLMDTYKIAPGWKDFRVAPIPVYIIKAKDMVLNGSHALSMEKGSGFNTFINLDNDPYFYLFHNQVGSRYISIKYRTSYTFDIQFYLGSTGAGPRDDNTMMRMSSIPDGEWHLAIFDTQILTDRGVYDGSTAAFLRFDVMETSYVYDENGNPIRNPGGWYERVELPEGASVDIAYFAFFDSVEMANLYEYNSETSPS